MFSFIRNNSNKIEGTEEAYMIIDMQKYFLPKDKNRNSLYSYYSSLLIGSISMQIDEILDNKKDIIIVNYRNSLGLVDEIKRKTKNYSQKIVLEKSGDGLLDPFYSDEKKRNLLLLEPFQESSLYISGINTTNCVLETIYYLHLFGFSPTLLLNQTLNLNVFDINEEFQKNNSTEKIIKNYKNFLPRHGKKTDLTGYFSISEEKLKKHQYLFELLIK